MIACRRAVRLNCECNWLFRRIVTASAHNLCRTVIAWRNFKICISVEIFEVAALLCVAAVIENNIVGICCVKLHNIVAVAVLFCHLCSRPRTAKRCAVTCPGINIRCAVALYIDLSLLRRNCRIRIDCWRLFFALKHLIEGCNRSWWTLFVCCLECDFDCVALVSSFTDFKGCAVFNNELIAAVDWAGCAVTFLKWYRNSLCTLELCRAFYAHKRFAVRHLNENCSIFTAVKCYLAVCNYCRWLVIGVHKLLTVAPYWRNIKSYICIWRSTDYGCYLVRNTVLVICSCKCNAVCCRKHCVAASTDCNMVVTELTNLLPVSENSLVKAVPVHITAQWVTRTTGAVKG